MGAKAMSLQLPLRFDGSDLDADDEERLTGQALRVFAIMSDGQWRTLREIATATGDPEASVSARLRDFRKPPHIHDVDRRKHHGGLWEYRLKIRDRLA
jgi:hypothetical protein